MTKEERELITNLAKEKDSAREIAEILADNWPSCIALNLDGDVITWIPDKKNPAKVIDTIVLAGASLVLAFKEIDLPENDIKGVMDGFLKRCYSVWEETEEEKIT